MEESRLQGTVKWYNSSRGYGFIISDGKEYFIHQQDIRMDGFRVLHRKENVSFLPADGEKGLVAKEVEVIR